MNSKSKIALSIICSAVMLGNNALSASACNLTAEELIEKYGYLCEFRQTWMGTVLQTVADERTDDPALMPSNGDVTAAGTTNGFRYELLSSGTARITGADYDAFPQDTAVLKLPEEIEGLPVTEIGYGAFMSARESLPELRELILPDTVEIIAERAFSRVFFSRGTVMKMSDEEKSDFRINMPENVKFIGYRAFLGCAFAVANTQEGSKIIHLPESLEYISSYAFDLEIDTRLRNGIEVDMPESLVFMSDDTFHTDEALSFYGKVSTYTDNIRIRSTFDPQIPEADLPLILSYYGQGFYQAQANIVSMKDMLWEKEIAEQLELQPIKRNPHYGYGFFYHTFTPTDPETGETVTISPKIDDFKDRAASYAPELLSESVTPSAPLCAAPAVKADLGLALAALQAYSDMTLMHQGSSLNADQRIAADADCDGRITLKDALTILQAYTDEKLLQQEK